jgi:hypothetical protein
MVRILFAALFAALVFSGWTICVEAGFALETEQFKRCFTEYQLHSLRALRTRAKGLTDAVAKKHGLCIDKKRFEFARCEEI